MKIIGGKQGSGKTTKLIRMSAETGDIIVTMNTKTKENTRRLAAELGLTIPIPLTYLQFMNHEWRGQFVSGFLIDDAEVLLLEMIQIGKPINALTFTTETTPEETSKRLKAAWELSAKGDDVRDNMRKSLNKWLNDGKEVE